MQVELDAAVADMRAAEERHLASQQDERVAHARAVGELRSQLERETAAMQEELTRGRQATVASRKEARAVAAAQLEEALTALRNESASPACASPQSPHVSLQILLKENSISPPCATPHHLSPPSPGARIADPGQGEQHVGLLRRRGGRRPGGRGDGALMSYQSHLWRYQSWSRRRVCKVYGRRAPPL